MFKQSACTCGGAALRWICMNKCFYKLHKCTNVRDIRVICSLVSVEVPFTVKDLYFGQTSHRKAVSVCAACVCTCRSFLWAYFFPHSSHWYCFSCEKKHNIACLSIQASSKWYRVNERIEFDFRHCINKLRIFISLHFGKHRMVFTGHLPV